MTDTTGGAAAIDYRTAAAIAEEALARVFGSSAVSGMREDSPLSAVGLALDDLVAFADAVDAAAAARGLDCPLGDPDLTGLSTVADVVALVRGRARAAVETEDRG